MNITRIKGYGWSPSVPDFRDHMFSVPRIANLPTSVDLRPQCPPVWDQGQLGSCTAHAAAGAYAFDLKKQGLPALMPSRLFIYYNERTLDGDVSSDAGSYLRTAAKALNQFGVCDESAWPYVETKFAKKPTPATKTYTPAKKHLAASYASLDSTNLAGLKATLASGLPFMIGFSVYASFESDEVARTGIVPMPAKSEAQLGGHAVLVVGYDDAKQRFIVRNSWGTGWGIAGYCEIPYAYLTNTKLASDFWVVKVVN
jgi:C1A family cysteine protease